MGICSLSCCEAPPEEFLEADLTVCIDTEKKPTCLTTGFRDIDLNGSSDNEFSPDLFEPFLQTTLPVHRKSLLSVPDCSKPKIHRQVFSESSLDSLIISIENTCNETSLKLKG